MATARNRFFAWAKRATCWAKSTYRAEGDAQPFTIAISREGLGTLMGTTKETTTRMLSEFKHEGMLTTRGSAITILAPRQLVAIATQFD